MDYGKCEKFFVFLYIRNTSLVKYLYVTSFNVNLIQGFFLVKLNSFCTYLLFHFNKPAAAEKKINIIPQTNQFSAVKCQAVSKFEV